MFRGIEPWPSSSRPISAMFRDHRRVLKENLRFVITQFGISILIWLVIGISLSLPAGLYLIQHNLAQVSDGWEGQSGFSVYLTIDAEVGDVNSLAQQIVLHEGVTGVQIVSPESALKALREHIQMSDSLKVIGRNPIPFSIRISPSLGLSIENYDEMKDWLLSHRFVDEVVLETAWIQRVQSLEAFVERLGYLLMLIFSLGAILVTAVSVRVAMDSRLEEIKVSHIVGGTRRFLRRPFYYFGFIYGVGGSVFGLMIIATVLFVLEDPLTKIYASYGHDVVFDGFDTIFLFGMLALGATLGVLGAGIASNHRMKNLDIS